MIPKTVSDPCHDPRQVEDNRPISIAAKEFGYSMSLSVVFETAMEDAISEFKEISGIDYKDIARTELNKKWESKYKASKKASKGKSQSKD
jgi:hypothetical protein